MTALPGGDVLFAVTVLHPTMHILSLPARWSSQRLSRRLVALAGASLMARVCWWCSASPAPRPSRW